MSKISTYLWPGKVHLGFGSANLAAQEVSLLGEKSVFVLVDPGVRQAGLLDRVLESLQASDIQVTVYDQVVPNPDMASVHAAADALRDAHSDVLIGMGGGSALDTAKAVMLLVGGPSSATIDEYSTALGDEKRPYPAPQDMLPYIAIPTTAGTGAEVTPWAVITRNDNEMKFGVGDATTIPNSALVDPALTMTLPSHLTASTGMDALSHLIEAYVSTNNNPMLDPLILHGIELIGRSLRTAVSRSDNKQARLGMMEASLLGGVAIGSNWLGACHSLAHPLSGLAGVHHGLACGIMLPHQMAYSLMGALERYAHIAIALDDAWTGDEPLRELAFGAVTAVSQLLSDTGLPTCLSDAGVSESLLPELAKAAYADLNWWTNPREVSEQAMAEMYRAAI